MVEVATGQAGRHPRLLSRRGCPGPPLLDLPPRPLRPRARASRLVSAWAVRMSGPPDFAELVAATHFSFLRGAAHPSDIIYTALDLGLKGIGIADINSVAGLVRAYKALKEAPEKAKAAL